MRVANHVVLRDGAAYDAMPPYPRAGGKRLGHCPSQQPALACVGATKLTKILDILPPYPRRLRWFYLITCGRVHALIRRGSVRRPQKFGGPFTLFNRQGGDGLTQLLDGGPLAVSVLHVWPASRGCSHSLATGCEWLVRSRSYFALV